MDANREDNIWVFDVRAEKSLNFGPRIRLRLYFDAFNLTNSHASETIGRATGLQLSEADGDSRAAHRARRFPLHLLNLTGGHSRREAPPVGTALPSGPQLPTEHFSREQLAPVGEFRGGAARAPPLFLTGPGHHLMRTRWQDSTTLVLGGTGKTGRRVAERLWALGRSVRLGSRSGSPPFDWEAPSTWPAAVHGVRSIYLSYYPDLVAPGAADAISAFTELAVKSGALQMVLLSGRGEPEAARCEEIVRSAALEWTIVRASWFNQNFSENYLVEPVLAGEVALPAGDVGEPFVDADDIADVAVAALTGRGHAGQTYEVTGPGTVDIPGGRG